MTSGTSIFFHKEDIQFRFQNKEAIATWLNKVARKEKFRISNLNYIFCSDQYLLEINQEYLDHDTLTDIITFDNSEEKNLIEGDIFISIDRVKENAIHFNRPFAEELRRVIVHGLLHLLGYKDKKPADQKKMRQMEDEALLLF